MSNIVSPTANGKATITAAGDKSGGTKVEKFEIREVPDKIKQSFEQAQYNLRAHEPFLSCILSKMRLGFSPQIDTAAVSIQRRGVVLYLSDWFVSLSPAERCALLKHEALHILHGHIPRSVAYYKMFGYKIKALLNIAQDLAINPDIRSLLPPGSRLLPPSNTFAASQVAQQKAAAQAVQTAAQAAVNGPMTPAQAIATARAAANAAQQAIPVEQKVGGQWPSMYGFPDGNSFDWYLRKLMEQADKEGGTGGGGAGEGEGEGSPGKGKGQGKGEPGDGEGAEGIPPPPQSRLDQWEKWGKEKGQTSLDRHVVDFDDEQPIEQPTGDEEYDAAAKPLDDPEAVARINEHILAEATKDYKEQGKGVGNMPGNYKDALEKILNPRPINWMNRFRNDLNQLRGGKKQATWKKPNRRNIPMSKGSKKGPRSRIGMIIDTSGSMSNPELQLALSETDNLSRKEEVFEIQCDTGVSSVRKRKPGDAWNVYGRGGTDLVPAFEYCEKEKYTAIICITDGGICRWPKKPKVPLIWVSTQQAANYPFGSVVRLTPQGHWWEPSMKVKKK